MHYILLMEDNFSVSLNLPTEGGELSVEEMYKRTLQEVGSLREQLGR